MYRRMGVKIGLNCQFQFDVVIDYSHYWLVEIGDNVILAPRVHILAHDASTKMMLGYTRLGRVRINSNVFVGAGAIILPGVEVGANSIIGAGSVVTKDVLPNSVYSGNPAKYICSVQEFLAKHKDKMKDSPKWDESYTIRGGVSNMKQREMLDYLNSADKTAYVV
jgi:maltose O-acetyltransferase